MLSRMTETSRWQMLLDGFVMHNGHLDLFACAFLTKPSHFTLLEGDASTGKSRSAERIVRDADGAFIKLGPWIDAPIDLALTIIDGLTGAWPEAESAEQAIISAVQLLRLRTLPLVCIDNLETIDRRPQHAGVLARIIRDSGTRFILSGRSGVDLSAMGALRYNRDLARLREHTVTFADFRPDDTAFDRFVRGFIEQMPIAPGPLTKDMRGRATLYCLSENGRIGEIARFFKILAETAILTGHKHPIVTKTLLKDVTDRMLERAGEASAYPQKATLF
jgi:hypothetical protein